MRNKKGFTLIELLVVVAIIGLLSTMGVMAFRDAQKKGRDTKRLGDIRAVVIAFAQAVQEGGYILCSASCGATPADGKVEDYAICNISGGACSGAPVLGFINLANMRDPLAMWQGTKCTAGSSNCTYAFTGTPTLDSFSLNFSTEKNNIPGIGQTNNHSAQVNGIVN